MEWIRYSICLVRFLFLEPLNIHTQTHSIIKYVQTMIYVGGKNKQQWRCCHGAGVPVHLVPCFLFLPSLLLLSLGSPGQETGGSTWTSCGRSLISNLKMLAMASLHGQIMLHPSVCASTRASPPAFVFFVFFRRKFLYVFLDFWWMFCPFWFTFLLSFW